MREYKALANSCCWTWTWLRLFDIHSWCSRQYARMHYACLQQDHQCSVGQSHSTPALRRPPVFVQPMMLHATVISGLKFDNFLQVSKAQSSAQRFASRRAWRQRQASSGPRTFRHRRISRARDSIHRARRRTNPSSQQRQ